MNLKRKKRLEKAGWRVGDADAFLGLTAEEAAAVDLRLQKTNVNYPHVRSRTSRESQS